MTDLTKSIDNILTFLELAEPENALSAKYPLKTFQEVEPFTDDWINNTPDDGRRILIFNDLKQLSEPLNVSILMNMVKDYDTNAKDNNQAFAAVRLLQVTAKNVRGKSKPFPFIIEQSLAGFHLDGSYVAGRGYLGSHDGKSWVDSRLGNWAPTSAENLAQSIRSIEVGTGVQFGRRYDWRVVLGYSGATISFTTDAVGAQESFRMRDIPNGKSRRAALRNWVEAHWRKKRKEDEQANIAVRKHLRGATEFRWNGLTCILKPSQFDIEKNEKKVG
jgi:hypothetical protein